MARRLSGPYSPQPGATPPPATATPPAPPPPRATAISARGQWRASVLFLAAFTFLLPAFAGPPSSMFLGLVAGGGLILSAWLTREGMRARAEWQARTLARRPAAPRILLGALVTGASLALGGVIAHGPSLYPALYALAGTALHLGAFGLDPMSNKGMEGIDTFQTDRVARAVGEAEKTLAQMQDAIERTRDRSLRERVAAFSERARALFRQVENHPGDLTAARRYLSVYLQGARDATVKFADLWVNTRDQKARDDFESLLADLETTFASRTQTLLEGGRTDLDVEISVLSDRLKYETRPGTLPTTSPAAPMTTPQDEPDHDQ